MKRFMERGRIVERGAWSVGRFGPRFPLHARRSMPQDGQVFIQKNCQQWEAGPPANREHLRMTASLVIRKKARTENG